MRTIIKKQLINLPAGTSVLLENEELIAIFAKNVKTAKSNL